VVTLLIDRLQLERPAETQLVACGPEVMMKYAAVSGIRLGLSEQQIWVSMERNMQCAAGLCGHCQLGPEFICKDGPVLRYDRLRQYLFVEQL
jgi:NAD(P)H-flavin reductase